MKNDLLKLIKKLLLFFPFVLLVTLTNYFVDPANIFQSNNYLKNMSNILLQGLNIAGVSNYDERLLNQFYIESLKQPKDIVVLGSSRSMQIDSTFFKNMSFFNNSVSGATLEDDMAIFEIYYERNLIPKAVILCLDSWILNKNNKQTRWHSIGKYYKNLTRRIKLNNNIFNFDFIFSNDFFFGKGKYLQLFSFTYFQKSFNFILKQFIGDPGRRKYVYPTNQKELDVPTLLADGSYIYARNIRDRKPEEAIELAKSYILENPIFGLGKFDQIDGKLKVKFEMFIEYLINQNIKIIFYLPPYHPYVYDYLIGSPRYSKIIDAENYFRNISLQNNILLVGSYNPNSCGFNLNDFYDGAHAKKDSIGRLFMNSLATLN